MNFLLSANNLYILPVSVLITSIFENHKDIEIKIFLLENDFTENDKNIIRDLGVKYNQEINIIHINDKYYNDVPVLRWSKETYYRLLFNEVLPRELDRILYLDCDIIINKNIKDFYYQDLGIYNLAALHEINNISSRERIDLDKDGKYFQAGVILFDLNKCRPILNYEKSIKIIEELGDNLLIVDQDVLNVAFDGKIKEISKEFNNMGITSFNNSNWNRLLNRVHQKEIEKTYIFHYASGKPWNNLFSGSAEKVWYKYLKLSPYKDLYYSKFNTLKYKILRTGIMKYLFYNYIYLTPIINNLFLKLLPKEKYKKLKNFYRKYVK